MYDNDTSSWVKADYYNIDSKYAGYDYQNKALHLYYRI